MKDFLTFIREQGVIGLAVGFILGGATSKLVSSLVVGIIQPLIDMMFGSANGLATMHYKTIMYGQFLVELLDFVIIAAVVYFIFAKLVKLDKAK